MLAYDLPLLLIEGARLVQDAVSDTHFANIMQRGTAADMQLCLPFGPHSAPGGQPSRSLGRRYGLVVIYLLHNFVRIVLLNTSLHLLY